MKKALQKSWSKYTSSEPKKWSPKNPAFGQCSVSSLVVQDYLGGLILNCIATLPNGERISHYYNKINGKGIDFAKSQFPKGTTFSKGRAKKRGFGSTRGYMLSYPSTKRRYNFLKKKVGKLLA